MLSALFATLLLLSPAPDAYHERAAKEFQAQAGLSGKSTSELDYGQIVEAQFRELPLGVFELRFPHEDLDKRSAELLKCAAALLDAQQLLLDWTRDLGQDQKPVREDLKLLRKWIGGLKEGQLARLAPGDKLPLAAGVAEAQARLAEALGKGALLGTTRAQAERVRLIVTPSRKRFVEFVSFAGWLDETNRGLFWVTGLWQWTSCFVRSDCVIALEYSAAGGTPDGYELGSPMNEQSPTTMEQQLVQLSLNALLERFLGQRVPQALIQGLSMNLVIEQFGIVNTRVDGDTRARQTQDREVFVRGGNSEGGELGKNFADSRWRELYGADHFLKILKQTQKEGADLVKLPAQKSLSFALRDDKGAAPKSFLAPFYCPEKPPEVPPGYAGDFDEFQRSYKSAFLHYLQTAAGGPGKKSSEGFARWVSQLAAEGGDKDLLTITQAVYGVPLSDAQASKDSLEGRFLQWLPKAREK